MPTAFEKAVLNLKLFELRREPVLREARAWFVADFNPESLEELMTLAGGERNASFRMVLGYWDMAASLVTGGVVDPASFLSAHGEIVVTFSKVHPFLAELRRVSGEANLWRHLEAVVLAIPDAETILERRRQAALGAAKARRAQEPE